MRYPFAQFFDFHLTQLHLVICFSQANLQSIDLIPKIIQLVQKHFSHHLLTPVLLPAQFVNLDVELVNLVLKEMLFVLFNFAKLRRLKPFDVPLLDGILKRSGQKLQACDFGAFFFDVCNKLPVKLSLFFASILLVSHILSHLRHLFLLETSFILRLVFMKLSFFLDLPIFLHTYCHIIELVPFLANLVL